MSLIKLAAQPVIIINKSNDKQNSSKTFSKQNIAAATAGATTGFLAKELVENKIPHVKMPYKFNKELMSHRYASRMGSVIGGFAGAAGLYHHMNKKDKNKQHNSQFYWI